MSKRYGTLEERFWRHVVPEPNSGCWLWDKLTEADVLQIRACKGQMTQRALAAVYGVSKPVIMNILNGRDWKHVANL